MRASIKKILVGRFRHLLKEGAIIFLQNFKVVEVFSQFRPIQHNLKIIFLTITTIKCVDSKISRIPMHGFQFATLDTVCNRVNDILYLTGLDLNANIIMLLLIFIIFLCLLLINGFYKCRYSWCCH